MEVSSTAVKAVLVTLGCAFILLSVNEWKNFADWVPTNDTNYDYAPKAPVSNSPYVPLACAPASPVIPPATQASSLSQCQDKAGAYIPWPQAIKAFVYTWIGVGLLVSAFIKKGGKAGLAGGLW